MANNNNRDFKHMKQHPEYYIADGNLHILVGDTHFLVHSHFFTRESSKFRCLLNIPAEPGKDRQGTSESNALVLDKNVTAEQFATFLWIFYDPKFSRVTSQESWTVILDLSNRWEFFEVKSLAISALESMSIPLIERIALYQKYNVPMEKIAPHYAVLCGRTKMLTLPEVETIGNETSVMIFSVRERLLSNQNGVSPLDKLDPKILQKTIGNYYDVQKRKSQMKDDHGTGTNGVSNGN